MMFDTYSFLIVPVFLVAAFLIPVAGLYRRSLPEKIALYASLISALLFAASIPSLSSAKTLSYTIGGWKPPYGISVAIDGMSAVFLAASILALILCIVFSREHLKTHRSEYYSLLCLFGVGMTGILHTADLFNMFVFFEILSISSYALACYAKNKGAFRSALNYLVLGSFGTSLMLLGIALLYGITGTLNMADIAVKLEGLMHSNSAAILTSYALIAAGILLKAAVVPLHAWKPAVIKNSMPEVGALFATASTATALYAFFRVSYTVFGFSEVALFKNMLLTAGIATMIVGALMAVSQKNLLGLLAYSTISQTGYILVAFGLANYVAGLFHLFNVIIIELTLFFTAGILIRSAGTSDIVSLGSKKITHPLLYWVMLLAFLSNAGVPLLNGFASKWMIYVSGAAQAPLVALVAVLVSAITFAYSQKAFAMIFSGRKNAVNIELSKTSQACFFMLAGLMIFFGVFYVGGIYVFEIAAESMLNQAGFIATVLGG